MKENTSYIIAPANEAEALIFIAKNEGKQYNFYIPAPLLDQNGLELGNKENNYYKKFIEQHIDSLITGVEMGFYKPRENRYIVIDRFANF